MTEPISIKDVQKSEEVKILLQASSLQMTSLGYTDHSFRHCRLVSNKVGEILQQVVAMNIPIELEE